MENAKLTTQNNTKILQRLYYESSIIKSIVPGLKYSKSIYHFKNKHVITSINLLQDTDLFIKNIAPLICIPSHDIHIIFNPFIYNPFTIDYKSTIDIYKRIINTIGSIINNEYKIIIYFPKEAKAFRYFIESELQNKCKKSYLVKFRYLPKSLKFCIQEKTNYVAKDYLELYIDNDIYIDHDTIFQERILLNEIYSSQYTFRKNYYEFLSNLKDYEFNAGINASQREMKGFIIDEFKTRNN